MRHGAEPAPRLPRDPAAFQRIDRLDGLSAAAGGLVAEVAGEPVRIMAWAPGVFRITCGTFRGADYGLVVGAPLVDTVIEGTTLRAGAARLSVEPDRLRLRLDGEGGRLAVQSITDEHFRGWTRLPALGRHRAGWMIALALRPEEAVYGLGEKFAPLDRRGQLVISRTEDALGVNTELAYKNVPFAWSSAGWGLFINTPATVVHGVGYAPWSHRSYALMVEDYALDLFLFAGSPAAILDAYTALTGRPAVPPLWSLGAWMSRAYYRTAEEAIATAAEIRRRRIPCDVLTLDGRAWLDVRTRFAFRWDETRYPDPAAALARIKAHDLKVCCWEYPLVSVHAPLHAELAAKGWLLKDSAGRPYRYAWDTDPATSPFGAVLTPLPESGIVDFTNPDAYAWWRDQHAPLFAAGVDVIKSDFGEQVPDDAVAWNGDSGARLHNVYPLLYNACVFEATERYGGKPALVWGRAGWSGSQRYPIQWGGDPQSDWGGFAASIRGGLSWGMSGVPCHATDIGGFYGAQPDAELFLRWLAQAVFASHLRFHGIGAREPWAFGEDAEAVARRLLEFRYQLIPYLMATVEAAARTGLPVMRAMPLAFPEDRAARGFELQYMVGDDLLVAPVTEPGGGVELWLPEGAWHDLWTGAPCAGGRVLRLTAPLDRIPVFVRAGTVLALGPVVQHTGAIDPAAPIAAVRVYGPPQRLAAGAAPHVGLAQTEEGTVLTVPAAAEVVLKGVRPQRWEAARLVFG